IKFSLEIVAQFEHRGKTRAFPASKATQWPNMFITDESLEFFATKQSPGNRLPNCEIALLICACKTFESFDNRGATLWTRSEWLAVGHVIIGMKMLCLADDFFSEMANIPHECVAGKFAMLDFTQAKFPFTGELRACQLGHRVF